MWWEVRGVLLADEFFCIAREDWNGRSLLHPRTLGLGLAGALLGELVLFGRIAINDSVICVVRRDPPEDPLAHETLTHLLTQPQHRDVRTWLAYLAETATDEVGQRLARAGVWRREERRRFGRVRVSWLPADVNVVAWRPIRLAGRLTSPEPIEVPDVVLAGLVAVTGLTGAVLWQPELREVGMARLSAEVARLDRSLFHLLAFVEAAVGDAVLAPR
ncbi:GPP34 family phosphoprotein [Dactylosporangium sp. NPDC050688]|uniref:GOLPH3/VPS74 family protein n=1 Tax=Dactylosporangium sp. NPDC050688 TaxID=3157217 RepID=UPI0033E49191